MKILKEIMRYILSLILQSTSSTTFFDSIVPTVKLGLIASPFLYVWNKIISWSMQNGDYMLIILGAILTDYVFGTIKHLWIDRDFSWKGNAIGLTTKLSLAVGGGFLFEGLTHLTSGANFLEDILKIITRVIVFIYPALSAWKNIHVVSGGKFPPKSWMERLDNFNNSLNLKDLREKEGKDEETNN